LEGAPQEGAVVRGGGWKAARRVRRAVQIAAFALFVYLLFAALQRRAAFPYADLFFRFDPLAAFGTMLAARQWLPHLALAVVTVAAALALGRVWCGWICPLGTLLEWFRFGSARRLEAHVPPRLRSAKYILLIVIAAMAALGGLTLLVLDPIALLTRTATTSMIPGLDYGVTAVEKALVGWGPGSSAVAWIEGHIRGSVLPVTQPHFAQAVALFLLFLAVVLLGVLADRFWCRYLCPLGALLGLLSKVQVLRPLVGAGCNGCGACARACRLGAIELADRGAGGAGQSRQAAGDRQAVGRAPGGAALTPAPAIAPAPASASVVTSECTMCLDCLVACPEREAMSFGPAFRPAPWAEYDPGRRQFVAAAAAGVGAMALLGTGMWRGTRSPGLIRPPGAQDEGAFLSRCLRCSECMKVCPTSGLQPSFGQSGLEGLWTPVLVPRLGYCDYACTACGHVCPSGAIPRLDLADKRTRILGLAAIDRDRCLPWAQGRPCVVCEEMCPTSDKAIVLGDRRLITRADGTQDYLARPRVIAERCIGCGICEYRCPLEGTAAIVVVPATRS
jgi:polyferredoxin